MKKYCECFQAGIVCSDLCKCVQCQNTDESANRKIVRELKKSDSESNPNLLYKILLSENKQHYNTIVDNGDKHSKIDSIWLDKSAALLFSILNQQAQDHLPSNRGPSQKPSEAVEENAEQPSSLQCNQKLDPASLQIKVEVAQPTSHTKLTRLVDTFINLLKDLQNREKQKMDVQL